MSAPRRDGEAAPRSKTSSGSFEFLRPSRFRFHYLKPFEQLIVADGDHIWIHDPDLEQVNVRNQSYEEQVSPLAVLIWADESSSSDAAVRRRSAMAWA